MIINSSNCSVGIIFGRFNPPHQGHRAAWQSASENDAWYVGTNSATQGPKDPLPSDIKIAAMIEIMPEVKDHIVVSKSWLTLASEIYQTHSDAILKLYTDEKWVFDLVKKYNGEKNIHGFYNYKNIELVKTPRISSATQLRTAVVAGDKLAFSHAAGISYDTPINTNKGPVGFFNLVEEYLNEYTRS